MPWALNIIPTLSTIPDIESFLDKLGFALKCQGGGEKLPELWCSEEKSGRFPLVDSIAFDAYERVIIHDTRVSPTPIIGILSDRYGIHEHFSGPEEIWDVEESSPRVVERMPHILKQNANVGFNLIVEPYNVFSCFSAAEYYSSKRLSALVAAAVIGHALNAVLITDEAWAEPFVGAYHWADFFDFLGLHEPATIS